MVKETVYAALLTSDAESPRLSPLPPPVKAASRRAASGGSTSPGVVYLVRALTAERSAQLCMHVHLLRHDWTASALIGVNTRGCV
jgi:hypothetical protein